jgi:hypothetical protein
LELAFSWGLLAALLVQLLITLNRLFLSAERRALSDHIELQELHLRMAMLMQILIVLHSIGVTRCCLG